MCLLLLLAGCRLPAEGDKAPRILRYATWGSASEMAVQKPLLADFERQHPGIRVELLHIPDRYRQKLHLLVAAGLTPDVVLINSLDLPTYAAHGVFRDLRPWLPPAEAAAFDAPARRALSDPQGRLLALPRDVSTLVVYVNRAALRAAELPDPPRDWDWSTYQTYSRRLSTPKTKSAPARFGSALSRTPPLYWLPFLWSWGGTVYQPGAGVLPGLRPAHSEGLQAMADLALRDHAAPRETDTGATTMTQLFLEQRVAMMLNGRWIVPVLREQAHFDWDVWPFPRGPAGSRVGVDATGWAVSTRTREPQAAWALVQHLASPEAMTATAESGLIIPARTTLAQSPVFLQPGQRPQHADTFLRAAASGVPTQVPPRWAALSDPWTQAMAAVWDGQASAADALSQLRQQSAD